MFLKLKLLHDLLLNVQNVLQYGAYITHYYLIAKNHPILVIIFLVISSNAICFRFSFLNYISHFSLPSIANVHLVNSTLPKNRSRPVLSDTKKRAWSKPIIFIPKHSKSLYFKPFLAIYFCTFVSKQTVSTCSDHANISYPHASSALYPCFVRYRRSLANVSGLQET